MYNVIRENSLNYKIIKLVHTGIVVDAINNYHNKVAGLNDSNYTTFATSNGDKVRTCVVAKKSLKLIFLSNFSGGDITAVRMECSSHGATIFSSIYMPFESPDPPGNDVEKLVKEMGSTCLIILGCDANAHHFHWGSRDTNARG
ncbi:uncharacterized protein [Musca autumnalis]|uniref:uncharacterized protein n=1 Tax=Musca autumnalis TaxID=221902 RepID=UPI003CEB1D8F